VRREAAAVGDRRRLGVVAAVAHDTPATPCSGRLADVLAAAVAAEGVRPRRLPSGAGHDAVALAAVAPVAMLFVRCAGGVSHHPDESVAENDVAVAIAVLERAVRRVAADYAARAAS
jgi:allantoate deiminase